MEKINVEKLDPVQLARLERALDKCSRKFQRIEPGKYSIPEIKEAMELASRYRLECVEALATKYLTDLHSLSNHFRDLASFRARLSKASRLNILLHLDVLFDEEEDVVVGDLLLIETDEDGEDKLIETLPKTRFFILEKVIDTYPEKFSFPPGNLRLQRKLLLGQPLV